MDAYCSGAPLEIRVLREPTDWLYQVFQDEDAYYFIYLGRESTGVTETPLCCAPEPEEALHKRSFTIAKQNIRTATFRYCQEPYTKLDHYGKLTLKVGGKQRNFLLLGDEDPQAPVDFFGALAGRTKLESGYRAQTPPVQETAEAPELSPEEAAKRAKRTNRLSHVRGILLALEVLASALFWLVGEPYVGLAVALMVLFLAALALRCCFPAEFDTLEAGDSIKNVSNANLLLLLPLVILSIRAMKDFNVLNWGRTIVFALLLGAVASAALLLCSKPLRRHKGMAALLCALLLLFSFGPVLTFNYALDTAEPAACRAEVVECYVNDSSASLNVRVALEDGRELDLQSTSEQYYALTAGDEVTVTIAPGALGIPHARLAD